MILQGAMTRWMPDQHQDETHYQIKYNILKLVVLVSLYTL